ncbi:MAG: hypothetical protein HUU20_11035 [Pirellulales bacterium]|nr:hypothetical protein [Pirellulales bacterium]
MTWEVDSDDVTWGTCSEATDRSKTRWSGMIGYLESQGLTYGGTIRAQGGRLDLPECFDARAAAADVSKAGLFVLKFSRSANTDGLGLKALELAEAIKEVRRLTGGTKVRLVAHSAGGVVARVYLQSALPGVRYNHDVDRLITIATPHLGSALASHFGDFLGTRATSLKPDSALLRELNWNLDLPADVEFASIVVRGIAADQRGEGDDYREAADAALLARLPVEYRTGGDQVVHVCSQNLRLAPCAARYERQTGRPVQYMLARVADPSPDDRSLYETRVHVAAPQDATVARLVSGLLGDGARLWQACEPEQLAAWIQWQARLHASGALEQYTIEEHPMSEVRNIELGSFAMVDADGDTRQYAFSGKTWSKNRIIPCRRRWTQASGTMDLTFDRFGRVVTAEATVR